VDRSGNSVLILFGAVDHIFLVVPRVIERSRVGLLHGNLVMSMSFRGAYGDDAKRLLHQKSAWLCLSKVVT